MKKLLLLFVFAVSITAYAKKPTRPVYTDSEIAKICDSILIEGNLLYLYENAAWISSDIGMANDSVKKQMFNYLVYEAGDTIRACLLNKNIECICEVNFVDGNPKPQPAIWNVRPLTQKEEKLFLIKNDIINNVINGNYQVGYSEGFNLNFVLLPMGDGYKLYILNGTNKDNIIPLGNDYIFFADKDGKITNWRKMHSGLLALDTKFGGKDVSETGHSHLFEEPFITPTDICTFMLYGPMYGQKAFTVFSLAIGKTIRYDLDSNSLKIENINSKAK